MITENLSISWMQKETKFNCGNPKIKCKKFWVPERGNLENDTGYIPGG